MPQMMAWAVRSGLYTLKARNLTVFTSVFTKQNLNKCQCKDFNRLMNTQSNCWFHNSNNNNGNNKNKNDNDEASGKRKEMKTDLHIIYYGEHESKIKGLKVVSYSSSILTILVQPYLYSGIKAMALPAVATIYTILGFFTFVTPLFIHSLTKKYVTEITYDKAADIYTYRTLTFFLRNKTVNFKLSDVESYGSPSLFNTFRIKGKPLAIFEEGFLDQSHYIKMLKYDVPIDLKLKNTSKNVSDNRSLNCESQK